MFGGAIGVPEVIIALVILCGWAIPLAAAVWALITLYRMRQTLERIEQLLQRQ